jgi:exopolysaccharide biosynthesis polyprenyl glycosylphosphotransferase
MKRSNIIFTAWLVPMDYLMLILAGLAAYYIRTSQLVSQWRPVLFDLELPFFSYFVLLLIVAAFWLVVFALSGLYEMGKSRKPIEEFFKIAIASSAGLMAVIVYIFISGKLFNSRFIVLAAWMLAIFFVFFGRLALRFIRRYLVGNRDYGIERVLIIGNDKVTRELIEEIKNSPSIGMRLAAQIPIIDMEAVRKIMDRAEVDEVLLGEINGNSQNILELINFCQERRIDFKFVPNLFQTMTSNLEVDALGGVPVIEMKRTALDGWGRVVKRTIDIVFSAILFIVFLPIMAIIALAVKLDSAGPVIYKNLRVGPKKNFKVYKFRSFYFKYCTGGDYPNNQEADAFENQLIGEKNIRSGPVHKIGQDPRRTRVGRFLEKWSLDELPQFWNVLRGEMSLVGPRPHMPKEVSQYQKHQMKVFNIKPGITGLGQISGRSDIDFEDEAKLDIYYIENWSLGLDIKIMFKTPFVVLFGRHKS